MAKQLEERHNEKGRPENSRWNKSTAIPDDMYSKEARLLLKECIKTFRYMSTEVANIKMSEARLTKPNEDGTNNNAIMFGYLQEAIEIYEFVLGFDHPEVGEAYSRMGLAQQESGDYRSASLWLRKSFCVFFKSLGPHDEVTLSVHQQMEQLDLNLDNKDLLNVPYE